MINLFMLYADNKGADQPAHPRSLISAFVVCCLDSIIPLVSISKISSLYLASVAAQAGLSVAAQAGLSLPRSQIPKTVFSRDEAHFMPCMGYRIWLYQFLIIDFHVYFKFYI